ncbi:ExeA family protein [Luteimonas terricola]|uniref:AAA+ ATPase domain-containing protein n=1 Tax=Luteimonas terricola TaxID=645597 RepID=A0ABQ2EEV5_9GAMM|nr:AAA family ATPase [Luteimonas terricola]GGK08757.1 hypothetical protein GCM10011394_17730 [Luteimonas terricola]
MTRALKPILRAAGIKQGALASALGVPRSVVNGLINHGQLPARYDREEIAGRITTYLKDQGADWSTWQQQSAITDEEDPMTFRKQTLTPQARRHFELTADPFADVQDVADVFMSDDIRYVREVLYGTALHGGFVAVVGESGAGKSTLREELMDRLQREQRDVHVIEPAVLASAETDAKGKPVKAQHIAEAIMATVAPLEQLKSSPDARFRQVKKTLVESGQSGYRHLIVIEEAHTLPASTLNHLKRFLEIKDGLRKLIGIVLLAQPELLLKLSESNPAVREVVQRCEVVTLMPLGQNLDGYLKHRFERAGVPVARVLERDAVDALRDRLAPTKQKGMGQLYPLAVHNLLARAMNLAAELGPPRVTVDVMRGV